MLKVTLIALLVGVGAAPKKPGAKKKPPAAQVEPAPAPAEPLAAPLPAEEPKPAEAEAVAPEPQKAPEPEPVKMPGPTAASGAAFIKPASAVETTKPKLVVLEVTPGGGIDPTVAAALGDAITLEIQRRGYFTATSMKELQTALGIERQRSLLGCAEAASSCMAELADAFGARFVLSGALTRLGDAYQLSLLTLDTTKSQPIGRSVRIAKDPAALIEQVPFAVAEATATQLPPPPSRVLPYTLIIGGGVFALAGGVLGLDAFSRERAVQAELEAARINPGVLRPLESYREDGRQVSSEKLIALVAASGGIALILVGVVFMPASGPSAAGSTSVAVLPSTNGVMVVGAFP